MTPALAYWFVGRLVLAATIVALTWLAVPSMAFDRTPLGPTAGTDHPPIVDGVIELEVDYGS